MLCILIWSWGETHTNTKATMRPRPMAYHRGIGRVAPERPVKAVLSRVERDPGQSGAAFNRQGRLLAVLTFEKSARVGRVHSSTFCSGTPRLLPFSRLLMRRFPSLFSQSQPLIMPEPSHAEDGCSAAAPSAGLYNTAGGERSET